MMKWLRNHTKQIMVVVVLLAMFSFVGAQGLQAILAPNPANEAALRAFGSDYTQGDLMLAGSDAEVLNHLNIRWKPAGAGTDFDVRHWFLLAEEAERAGVQVSDVKLDNYIRSADQMLSGVGGIDYLRKQYNIGLPQVRHALSRYLAIMDNAMRVSESALPSEPQVREYVRDTEEKVSVKMAVFDAKNFITDDMAVSEPELEAQFNTYRDVLKSESPEGFGYKYPRRVTIQYVAISPTALQAQMDVSLDTVMDYWKAHKDEPAFQKSEQVPVPPDPTTTQPAEPKTKTVTRQMLFTEARPRIERKLKSDKAKRIARQMTTQIIEAMAKPWAEEQRDTDGYLPIPSDEVRNPNFMKQVVDKVAGEFGLTPTYGELKLASADQISDNQDLSGAALQSANGESADIDIAELAFHVPAFFKPKAAENTEVRLQYFQAPPAPLRVERRTLVDVQNNQPIWGSEIEKYVVFRVTEARDSEAPTSLDEIRDQLVQDVKISKAYEKMAEECRELGVASQMLGTETALTLFDDLRKDHEIRTIRKPGPFARKQQVRPTVEELEAGASITDTALVPPIGRSRKFVDACFAMADENWKAPLIEAPMSSQKVSKAQALPPAVPTPKVQIVDLPKEHMRVVVEFVSYTPVDRDKYETTLRQQAYSDLASARTVSLIEWFDTKRIEERCGYVDVRNKPVDTKSGIVPEDATSGSSADENT